MRTIEIYRRPSNASPDHCEIILVDGATVRGFTETLSLADAYESIRRHGQTWLEARRWYGGPVGAVERGVYMRSFYQKHGRQPVDVLEITIEAPSGVATY